MSKRLTVKECVRCPFHGASNDMDTSHDYYHFCEFPLLEGGAKLLKQNPNYSSTYRFNRTNHPFQDIPVGCPLRDGPVQVGLAENGI